MSSNNVETAVIFVAGPGDIEATSRCLDHCKAYRYDVIGVVARDWDAAAAMLRNGTAGVLVIDKYADLPADATPRFEVVAERQSRPASRNQRRTRVIRRGAAT